MSKRRNPGDVVFKLRGAGMCGAEGFVLIPLGSEPDNCFGVCGDPDCQEWPDLWACDKDGNLTGGGCCHVSECQMIDVNETTD